MTYTERVDFSVLGKTPELFFRKGELTVNGDLEHPAHTFYELDFSTVLLFKPCPRTEGSGKVVSRNAVFDPDLHSRSLSQQTTTTLYHIAQPRSVPLSIAFAIYDGEAMNPGKAT